VNPLQFSLLQKTVAYAAARSSFYRRTIGHLGFDRPEDLLRFPVINRQTLVRQEAAIRVPGLPVHYVNASSGTTSSKDHEPRPLLQFRSEGERNAARELIEHQLQAQTDQSALFLRLTTGSHGHDMGGGVSGLITAPFNEPHHLLIVRELLQKTFEWGGITRRIKTITASNYVLKALTLGMMRAQIHAREFGISYLVSKGDHLTDRWKRILGRVWRARILDVYGLSEVPGFHCTPCAQCGSFRPSRTAITEFLDVNRDVPASEGLARIVATALYPLAELTPIIRYDTGDFAYRRPGPLPGCEECFVLLGRDSDLTRLSSSSGDPYVLSRLAVANVLDSLPPAARSPEEPIASSLGIRREFGHPIFSVSVTRGTGRDTVTVAIKQRAGWGHSHWEQSSDLRRRLSAAIFPPAARDAVCIAVRSV
jgi:phenylacetate-coenzyme A ligase PaaK-like adenylate-forming protein